MPTLLQVSTVMFLSSLVILIVCSLIDASFAKFSVRDFARNTKFIAWEVMLGSVAGIVVGIMLSILP